MTNQVYISRDTPEGLALIVQGTRASLREELKRNFKVDDAGRAASDWWGYVPEGIMTSPIRKALEFWLAYGGSLEDFKKKYEPGR